MVERKKPENKLRQKAEQELTRSKKELPVDPADTVRLIHELQVHQIELEIQKEELLRVQKELEESRNQYHDLYDYAPVGYFTLNLAAKITRVNLTGSDLLGEPKDQLLNVVFSRFIEAEETDSFYLYVKKVLSGNLKQTLELKMHRADQSPFYAHVEGLRSGSNELRLTLIDISDQKQAEEALAHSKDELEIKVKERTAELAEANKLLKQYAIKVTQVQEEERKRIAYELHDDTAQYLSILKMQLGALVESGSIQDPRTRERLQLLENDADRAFNDVRRYSHELRPVVLEHQGLAAALEQIAEDYNKLGQLPVEVQITGEEPELTEATKLGFFRIAQEALNNVRKHAKADQANIDLMFTLGQVRMLITDDGLGFDIEEAFSRNEGRGSLGLLSMRERADLIRADLKIRSLPGKGTQVILKARV